MAKRRKKRTKPPALTLNWVKYRTKGAVTIFNRECYDLLTLEQIEFAEAARQALLRFIDSVETDEEAAAANEDN